VQSALETIRALQPDLGRALEGVERAAATDATILILGEPGTGRSHLARAIHAASPRAGEPLVEVDPSATPAALFEGELFGWRRGAFSGAERDHDGRVARAGAGTLLFDPVEGLPLELQPKLLRLLSERSWTPLGGRERTSAVRFLAVGSEDLEQRVGAGAFRADLYYRLAVVSFRLPPLRDRHRDFEVLFELVGRDVARRLGREWSELSPATERWMRSYAWPGNLRELRNRIEQALILGRATGRLEVEPPREADRWPAPRTLREVECDEIRRALAHTAGHQGHAAELLGISRKALWEKRKRFGLR
jgi:DNA-binding NtrC family response regulator